MWIANGLDLSLKRPKLGTNAGGIVFDMFSEFSGRSRRMNRIQLDTQHGLVASIRFAHTRVVWYIERLPTWWGFSVVNEHPQRLRVHGGPW